MKTVHQTKRDGGGEQVEVEVRAGYTLMSSGGRGGGGLRNSFWSWSAGSATGE